MPEFWSDDARSRNHDMMGHIMEWFYREVGGIYSRDGFKTVEINPHFVGNLSWIRCAYDSIAGKIEGILSEERKPLYHGGDNSNQYGSGDNTFRKKRCLFAEGFIGLGI